jgi:hypothetical protein
LTMPNLISIGIRRAKGAAAIESHQEIKTPPKRAPSPQM